MTSTVKLEELVQMKSKLEQRVAAARANRDRWEEVNALQGLRAVDWLIRRCHAPRRPKPN